jgi:hypothetical protein
MHAAQALYRGNGANVLRLVPEVGFKFALADQFRVIFSPADGRPLGVREKAAAGAATGEWGDTHHSSAAPCRCRRGSCMQPNP